MDGEIRFGALIPQGWRPDLPRNLSSQKQWDLILETTRLIERLGFESAWLFDHILPWPEIRKDPCLECWTLLSALATVTERLRLGQLVTCNSYRNPAVLAKMAATLDCISGGRLEFGIGGGWYKEEYAAYGYEFPKPATRLRMMEESLQIVQRLWAEEKATFEGKYYRIKDAICNPKPVQKPHPPITVGGGGEKFTLRIAAKYADRVNFGGYRTYDEYERKFKILEGYCSEIGRDNAEITRTLLRDVFIAETESEAKRKAMSFWPEGWESERLIKNSIIGDPASCLAQLERWKKLGINYFIIYFPNAVELEPIELFAKSVMPSLAKPAVKSARFI